MVVEQQDNSEKIKKVICRSDKNKIDDSSQKNVLFGGKDAKVLRPDTSRKINKPIPLRDNSDSNILASQGDVPAGGEDAKTDNEYKIQMGNKQILESGNGNNDVPSQDNAGDRGKDVEVEKKDKVWKKNQLNLLIDDDNLDVPLQSMMRNRIKDAKMSEKNKGQKKELHVSMNDNDDGSIPLKNATPVEDVFPLASKDVQVDNLNEGQVKKQIVLETANDGDFISDNDSSAKVYVFGGYTIAKVVDRDKSSDLRRKFRKGIWFGQR